MASDTPSPCTSQPSFAESGERELDALYAITQILSSHGDQRQRLSEVLDLLDARMGLHRGTILLLLPDMEEIFIEMGHSLGEDQRRAVRYRRGEGVTGRVIQSGRPVVVPRISEEPAFLDRAHQRRRGEHGEISFICVPVAMESEIIGALSVDRPYDASADLEKFVRFTTIVAGMIANDVKFRQEEEAERRLLAAENLRLRSELEDRFRPENLIGNSGAMRAVYRAIHQVASSDATVLIRGESGTGKELVAHAIHYTSARASGPFVKVNCAALSETLLESELFGHEKGAFTGAVQARKGRIEEAEGGTLFLDEIGEFSPAVQVKLLRALQERTIERVGSNRTIQVNVRVLVATNRDLEQAVGEGHFRQDLYYRVNVFPIFLPPLRERKDDILLLADHFVEKYARKMNKTVRRITTPAINMMVAYHWPGNVRELENCIERAVLLSDDDVIHAHHLPPTLQTSEQTGTAGRGSLQERTDLFHRDLIIDALKRTGGNMAAAAEDLGCTPRILRYKVRRLEIDWKQYR